MASKTPSWQRIIIWVIAIAMAGGTLLGFFFMAFAAKNPEVDPTQITAQKAEQAQAELTKKEEERQKKVDAQNEELTKKYYAEFNSYKSQAQAFEPVGIGDVKTEDLKVGGGAEVTADGTDYSMYYIGWKPNGDIFDSSFEAEGEKLKSPLPGGGNYITGWSEGVVGMKVGGVRLITIPADKAYSGEDYKDHALYDLPLKFIVMAVPTPDAVPYPKGTMAACLKVAKAQYAGSEQKICEMYGYSNEEK